MGQLRALRETCRMRRVLSVLTVLGMASCGPTAESYGNPHDLGVALTKGGLRCEIDQGEFNPDDYPYMPGATRDLFEAEQELHEEYDMATGICELPQEESALVATFDSDGSRDRFLDEQGDEESVYVVGPRWLISVDSVPTAESITGIIGGDIEQ